MTSDNHGLKILDMNSILEDNKNKATLLKQIEVGALGKVIYDEECARIVFMSS